MNYGIVGLLRSPPHWQRHCRPMFVFIVAFEAVTLELPSLTVGDTMPVINTVIGNDYKLNQINAEDDNGCTYRSSMAVSTWTGMAIHGYLQLRSGRQTPCCVVYRCAELISECVAPRLYYVLHTRIRTQLGNRQSRLTA